MARGDIRQRITLVGGEAVSQGFRAIGAAGEKAAQDLRVALGAANVGLDGLSAAATGLRGHFAELAGFFGAAAGPAARLTGAIGALTTGIAGIPLAVGAAVAAMGALAGAGARFVSEIEDGAFRVGTSAENFVGFKFAIEQSGGSADDFERAMRRILEASGDAEQAGDATESASEKILAANRSIGDSSREVGNAYRNYSQSIADTTRQSQATLAGSIGDLERDLRQQTRGVFNQADLTKLRGQFDEKVRDLEEKAQADLAATRRDGQIKLNREIAEINQKAYQKWQDDLAAANLAREQEIDRHFGAQKNKFQEFGVALREAGRARDPTEVFRDVAEKISQIPDPADRAAKALELFGRAGPRLNDLLSKGAAGIDLLVQEAKQLGLVPTAEAIKVGTAFDDTMQKISASAAATTGKVGIEFAKLFLPLGEAIAQAFGRAQGPIVAGAAAIRRALQPLFDQITKMIRGEDVDSAFLRSLQAIGSVVATAFGLAGSAVGGFLRVMSFSFDQIAGLLRDVFGAKVVAGDIPAFIAAMFLASKAVGIFNFALQAVTRGNPLLRLLSLIAAAIVALVPLIEQHWPAIQKKIGEIGQVWTELGDTIRAKLNDAIQFVVDKYAEASKFINEKTALIGNAFTEALQAIQGAWSALWSWVDERISDLLQWLEPLLAKLRAVAALLSQMGDDPNLIQAPLGTLETPGAARGGRLFGPGTGTSDSMLIRASTGEYIVNAAATRLFLPLLEAINRNTAPRFAQGGLFDPSSLASRRLTAPRFVSSAQLAEGGTAVHLHLDGRVFGLRGEPRVVEHLMRAARNRAIVSGGRPQSWKRA